MINTHIIAGQADPRSAWYKCTPIKLKNIHFETHEHLTQFIKLRLDGNNEAAARVLLVENARDLSPIGRSAITSIEWDLKKVDILKGALWLKYNYSAEFKSAIDRDAPEIEYALAVNDTFWGTGLLANKSKGTRRKDFPGSDVFGNTLTEFKNSDDKQKFEYPDLANLISTDIVAPDENGLQMQVLTDSQGKYFRGKHSTSVCTVGGLRVATGNKQAIKLIEMMDFDQLCGIILMVGTLEKGREFDDIRTDFAEIITLCEKKQPSSHSVLLYITVPPVLQDPSTDHGIRMVESVAIEQAVLKAKAPGHAFLH